MNDGEHVIKQYIGKKLGHLYRSQYTLNKGNANFRVHLVSVQLGVVAARNNASDIGGKKGWYATCIVIAAPSAPAHRTHRASPAAPDGRELTPEIDNCCHCNNSSTLY
jgi:hypothetical protein